MVLKDRLYNFKGKVINMRKDILKRNKELLITGKYREYAYNCAVLVGMDNVLHEIHKNKIIGFEEYMDIK